MQSDYSGNPADTKGEAPALSPLFRLETLKTRHLFKDAANGPRFSTPAFTMLRRPTSEADMNVLTGLRFGFTVTKKIGGAVERNRIRRRLKAAVCAAAPDYPDVAMDLVILARKEAISIGFEALVQDIARSLATLARRGAGRKPPAPRISAPPATKTGETRPVMLGKPNSPD